jgi:trk system potassium uptake protein TrkA
MKTFVVIGLSTFGQYVARYLSERDFNVIALDNNEERVESIKSYLNKGIIANAKDRETLEKIGVKEAAGVIVTLGEGVDDSLLVLLYLKELGVKNLFVKAITEDQAKIVNLVADAEIIFPERESAFRLAQRVDNPNVLDYIPLGESYSIIDWAPAASFVGKTLSEVGLKTKYGVQVVSVERTIPERVKLIPRGNYIIRETDILVLIGQNEALERLEKVK